MNFIEEKLDRYVVEHSEEEPELLQRLSKETYQKILQPRMLSGHYQGRILSLLSKLKKPKNILEIGTYTGYSALCLAEGLASNGHLHTIDINEELAGIQKKYFSMSPFHKQITTHTGKALEIIPKISIGFDLIFIDADKPNYVNYFNATIDKLNSGGILISDNVLWSGKVIEHVNSKDYSTMALLEYNKLLKEDNRIETVVLPIRDGLTLSIKK
jgi:predicted O-methyltransferase YrrM